MRESGSDQHRALVSAIVAHAVALRPANRAPALSAYLGAYFANVAATELAARDPADLAAAALAHLAFARQRRGAALVRVFNPTRRADGYTSAHTIVEMVGDDMPFLVDSIRLALSRSGTGLHFLVHPVLAVARDRAGRLRSAAAREDSADGAGRRLESFQHVEIDRMVDASAMAALAGRIGRNLGDARAACADWRAMQRVLRETIKGLPAAGGRFDPRDLGESRDLLKWMESRHFTFLGYTESRLRGAPGRESLVPVEASGLGILRRGRPQPESTGRILPADIRRQSRSRNLVLVTKSNVESTVHRPGFLDYVGVKRLDGAGRVIGERRFLGLWTSAAYNSNPRDIPLVRHKVAQVIGHFAMAADSHDGKTLQHILETFPRDELFQAGVPELIRTVSGIFGLAERPRVRLLLRRDPFRRFYSCLVFVPRERYNTQVRERIEQVVRAALEALSLESQVQVAESSLARIHIVARTLPAANRAVHVDALERQIEAAVRSWPDAFKTALLARFDEAYALTLFDRYARAFPAAYTEDFDATAAAFDVSFLEAAAKEPGRLHLEIYRPEPRRREKLFLKIFRGQEAIPICDLLPMLENMGLKVIAERPYELGFGDGSRGWIQDLELEMRLTPVAGFETLATEIMSILTAVWTGRTDSDSFNQLTLYAGVPWRIVTVLRAYGRFLLQTGLPFSQGYLAQVLVNNAALAALFADLFVTRFDPALAVAARRSATLRLESRIRAAIEEVARSDEDRILRAYWHALMATVRTNAFRRPPPGETRDYLSFKIESQRLREMPLPKPLCEIFVFSPRMEGVHLRMGRVARGGIRWSDRPEDFRTEILGLMKAQNVKNTVIVAVGAKGGFVVRRPPSGDREAQQAEVIECYRTLVRGLLDITDNIVSDAVVPPDRVVRHDGDDPYLVVAADKGTSTFSDIANALSAEYGFWLGDAFASGGSAGYDHKKMAITARGAWECVKRHFREIGVDAQRDPVSVAGIGDMAGDVFGNGMLQSEQIRLVAAFNHQHIFIDPQPDTARSFRERARLFRLPRSSWADYSRAALSAGGAVHPRSAKTLKLSREAQALLQTAAEITPNEAVRAILKMPVDLLWNGGIGTYVKSAGESHADVGDRGNDAVRVDAQELRCKVVGEGGNLGMSQLGRIDYARRGGRLNTDFIDNSAGVNCSDVEVNIKILLNSAVRAGDLTRRSRDRLLAAMTGEVASLVLRNNYLQGQAISLLELHAREHLAEMGYVVRALERAGDLNRALEFLPTDEEFAERRKAGEGLTRPELAIVLCYGKIWLYKALINSDVPEDPYLSAELARYFPAPVQRRFAARLKRHRLRREIIATAITNSLINRMGPAFPVRAGEDTGADPAAIARAYSVAREIFEIRRLWSDIEALDDRVAPSVQYGAIGETSRLLRHVTYGLLTSKRGDLDIDRAVRRYRAKIAELTGNLTGLLGAGEKERVAARRAELIARRVPEKLAMRIASLGALHGALDVVDVSSATRSTVPFAAGVYFELGERIGLAWIRRQIESLAVDGHWQEVARRTLLDDLYDLHRRIARAALERRGKDPAARLTRWCRDQAPGVDALKRMEVEMRAGPGPDFATLSVALQMVRRLGEG